VQLASQFNFLEAPSRKKVPVWRYLFDKTQGPRGSIETAAATLHRAAAEGAGKLPHALANVIDTKAYSNGYLELATLADDEQTRILNQIDANITKLRILPQWVINEASGNVQLHVLAAAPSYQGKKTPKPGPIGEKICDSLVVPQYRAIAELAVIRSILTNHEVRLHLTLVGQGVFKNPVNTLRKALTTVADVVRGFPKVTVFVHAFSEDSQERVRMAHDASAWKLEEWSAEQFKAAR
jgi:hypothetical protein